MTLMSTYPAREANRIASRSLAGMEIPPPPPPPPPPPSVGPMVQPAADRRAMTDMLMRVDKVRLLCGVRLLYGFRPASSSSALTDGPKTATTSAAPSTHPRSPMTEKQRPHDWPSATEFIEEGRRHGVGLLGPQAPIIPYVGVAGFTT